jgi:hypothetical protein
MTSIRRFRGCPRRPERASWPQIAVKLRRRKAGEFAILAAVIALGGAALADALRDGDAADTAEAGADQTAATAATTDARAAPELRLPGMAAPGRIVFTDARSCELRAFDIQAGRFVDLPPVATTCELWAPRVGTHVAYVLPDDLGDSSRHFSVRNLDDPQAEFGEYTSFWPGGPAPWSWDGSKLAWCNTPGSGFELSFGRRPVRLNRCVWAYGPGGEKVSVKRGRLIVIDGRPPIAAGGFVRDIAWGVDGSLAVLVDRVDRYFAGPRVDRYEDGRLVSTTDMLPSTVANSFPIADAFSPDNCAALSLGAGVVELIDVGCFRGSAPRTFPGLYAAWSPDGDWIAVAQPNAVVFHRVVGPAATVRWEVAVGQLAWVGD